MVSFKNAIWQKRASELFRLCLLPIKERAKWASLGKKRQTTVEPAEKALVLCQTSKMNVAKCNDDAICEVLVTRPVAVAAVLWVLPVLSYTYLIWWDPMRLLPTSDNPFADLIPFPFTLYAATAFIPPLLLLALGYCGLWVGRGFRR